MVCPSLNLVEERDAVDEVQAGRGGAVLGRRAGADLLRGRRKKRDVEILFIIEPGEFR